MKNGLIRVCALMLACLFCALTLCGCHGSRGQQTFVIPAQLDESRDFEITFWAKNDTNKAQVAIYENAVAGFETLYPNIRVNLRLYTDYSRIYNDVITNISTKTTPNVCITYPDHIATYLTGDNTVVPLDDLMADPKYGLGGSEVRFDAPAKDEIVPRFLTECTFGGHTYAMPFMRSTEACYVNIDYVQALGYELPEVLTWDFVFEVSEAAMAKNADGTFAVNGQNVMIPFIYKSTDNMMIQMLRQRGAGYSTEAGEVLLFNDDVRSILLDLAPHVRSGAFSTFKISSYPANFLNAGQCIFAVDSTAGATWMGSQAPLSDIPADQYVQFETKVYPVPQYDAQNMQMISQGPSVCVFNKDDPQEVLASWLFVQYLLTDDVQTAYAGTEGYVPVTLKAQNSAEYIEYLSRSGEDTNEHYDIKIAASELLLGHMDDLFVTPVFNGSASLRDAAGQLIENVTKSVRRKQEVSEDTMDKLFDDVRSLYRLDQIETGAGDSTELGPLPAAAKALLITLACVWVLLGVWALIRLKRSRRA